MSLVVDVGAIVYVKNDNVIVDVEVKESTVSASDTEGEYFRTLALEFLEM